MSFNTVRPEIQTEIIVLRGISPYPTLIEETTLHPGWIDDGMRDTIWDGMIDNYNNDIGTISDPASRSINVMIPEAGVDTNEYSIGVVKVTYLSDSPPFAGYLSVISGGSTYDMMQINSVGLNSDILAFQGTVRTISIRAFTGYTIAVDFVALCKYPPLVLRNINRLRVTRPVSAIGVAELEASLPDEPSIDLGDQILIYASRKGEERKKIFTGSIEEKRVTKSGKDWRIHLKAKSREYLLEKYSVVPFSISAGELVSDAFRRTYSYLIEKGIISDYVFLAPGVVHKGKQYRDRISILSVLQEWSREESSPTTFAVDFFMTDDFELWYFKRGMNPSTFSFTSLDYTNIEYNYLSDKVRNSITVFGAYLSKYQPYSKYGESEYWTEELSASSNWEIGTFTTETVSVGARAISTVETFSNSVPMTLRMTDTLDLEYCSPKFEIYFNWSAPHSEWTLAPWETLYVDLVLGDSHGNYETFSQTVGYDHFYQSGGEHTIYPNNSVFATIDFIDVLKTTIDMVTFRTLEVRLRYAETIVWSSRKFFLDNLYWSGECRARTLDLESIKKYGLRSFYEKDKYLGSDSLCATRASMILATYSTPATVVERIVVPEIIRLDPGETISVDGRNYIVNEYEISIEGLKGETRLALASSPFLWYRYRLGTGFVDLRRSRFDHEWRIQRLEELPPGSQVALEVVGGEIPTGGISKFLYVGEDWEVSTTISQTLRLTSIVKGLGGVDISNLVVIYRGRVSDVAETFETLIEIDGDTVFLATIDTTLSSTLIATIDFSSYSEGIHTLSFLARTLSTGGRFYSDLFEIYAS